MPKTLIIKDLIPKLASSIAEFEKEIGAGNGAIAKAWNRDIELSDGLIRKILKRYPTVSEHYLETGEGEMFVKEGKQQQEPQLTNNNNLSPLNEDYRLKYERLLEKTNAEQSAIITGVLNIITRVDTNLSRAIKDQEGYHNSISANHEVMFDALDEIRHAPAGTLAAKADNLRFEHAQSISKKDSVGV